MTQKVGMTMKYNVLTYLIGEGISNVFKNKKQSMTAFGIMCATMLVFGAFLIMVENINHFLSQVEQDQGIEVFIENDATQEDIDELEKKIKSIDGVNTTEFKSKDVALEQMKDRLGEKSYLLEGYDKIFPASYVVTLTDLSLSEEVQKEIESFDNVKKITSSDETINTLIKIANVIRIVTAIILVFLIIVSIFIISNTIKLTVHARRKEISIMKYVGATNGFIRWPFAVEGMIIGLMSGAVSIGLVSGIYTILSKQIIQSGFLDKLGLTLLNFGDMVNLIIIVFLILGVGIGILGSTISMRKYLKV